MDTVIIITAIVVLFSKSRAVALLLAIFALCNSCSAAEAMPRFEMSIVLESENDRASANEATRGAAELFRNQLGMELVTVYSSISNVAEHTKPEALLTALQDYRLKSSQHSDADVTVLFTRRTLTRNYDGIATVSPACSSGAAAVVELHDDGIDYQVTAHELIHTLGVPHDAAPGWLMSEALTRTGNDKISPDTLATVKAAPLGCMLAIEPRTADQPSAGVPSSDSGGGGAFGLPWLACLFGLMLWRADNAFSNLLSNLRRRLYRLVTLRSREGSDL